MTDEGIMDAYQFGGDKPARDYVLRAVGFAGGGLCPHSGQYLFSFDFDAYEGQGYGEFTDDIWRAKTFPDAAAALTFWRTVSTIRPVRDDGKPNRPLTALTVVVEQREKPP